MPGRSDRRRHRRGLWVGLFHSLFGDDDAEPVADGGREGENTDAQKGK